MKTMKQFIVFGFIAAALLLSCKKENFSVSVEEPVIDTIPGVPMSISAYFDIKDSVLDTKTVFSDSKVTFTSSDKLLVYGKKDSDIRNAQFIPVDVGRKVTYKFKTDSWPDGYVPTYAVLTTDNTGDNTCTDAGVITMKVNNANRVFDWTGSYPSNTTVHVGRVTSSDGNTFVIETLKNLCSIVGFTLSHSATITRIVVEGRNDEYLGGWVTVDYSQLDEDYPVFSVVEGKGTKQITLTVGDKLDNKTITTGGFVPAGTQFYFSILPGIYSNGLKISIYDGDGNVAERNIGGPLKLKRSKRRNFALPLDTGFFEQPDTIKLSLGGSPGWTLTPDCVESSSQQAGGDDYQYHYDEKIGWTADYDWSICKGTGSYSWDGTENTLSFTANDSWIKLPAVEGKRLWKVSVTNGGSSSIDISVTAAAGGTLLKSATAAASATAECEWYLDDAQTPAMNTASYLNILSSGSIISGIRLEYVDELKYQPLPETFTISLNFYNSGYVWPFDNPITAKTSQTSSGESYNYTYNYYLGGKDWTKTLEFGVSQGPNGNTYSQTNNGLTFMRNETVSPFPENTGCVKTPAIPGRYLSAIAITSTTLSHVVYVLDNPDKDTSGKRVEFTTTQNVSTASPSFSSNVNTSYYVFRKQSTRFTFSNLTLTYSTPSE